MKFAQTQIQSPLKWAGGKRWLVRQHPDLLPSSFKRYFEAFLGGGSVFLALKPQHAVLADSNSDLIGMYRALSENWRLVYQYLKVHASLHGEDYYYLQRSNCPIDKFERAAWFLYMNRACYNGLYRVNRKGVFNVPKGTKTDIILKNDDFSSVSFALQNAKLLTSDFEDIVNLSSEGDFVYLDPPYTVRHNNNGFVKYNENIFTWSDQERLALAVRRAVGRGVMVGVSNANHDSLIELYDGIGDIIPIKRFSVIGGLSSVRSLTSEIYVRAGY